MSTALALKDRFIPQSFAELEKFAAIAASSDVVPKDYKGKPGNIVIAVQMGAELGLPPAQALQSIAVINGRPSIYGDAILALIMQHPDCEWVKESYDDEKAPTVASCTIKRKGYDAHTTTFSIEDAKRAGLHDKPGPWTQYRARMLRWRARGFCARDTFPDALKGIISAEEAQDMPPEATVVVTDTTKSRADQVRDALGIKKAEFKDDDGTADERYAASDIADAEFKEVAGSSPASVEPQSPVQVSTEDGSRPSGSPDSPKMADEEQIKTIRDLKNQLGWSNKKALEFCEQVAGKPVRSPADLTELQAASVTGRMKAEVVLARAEANKDA